MKRGGLTLLVAVILVFLVITFLIVFKPWIFTFVKVHPTRKLEGITSVYIRASSLVLIFDESDGGVSFPEGLEATTDGEFLQLVQTEPSFRTFIVKVGAGVRRIEISSGALEVKGEGVLKTLEAKATLLDLSGDLALSTLDLSGTFLKIRANLMGCDNASINGTFLMGEIVYGDRWKNVRKLSVSGIGRLEISAKGPLEIRRSGLVEIEFRE